MGSKLRLNTVVKSEERLNNEYKKETDFLIDYIPEYLCEAIQNKGTVKYAGVMNYNGKDMLTFDVIITNDIDYVVPKLKYLLQLIFEKENVAQIHRVYERKNDYQRIYVSIDQITLAQKQIFFSAFNILHILLLLVIIFFLHLLATILIPGNTSPYFLLYKSITSFATQTITNI